MSFDPFEKHLATAPLRELPAGWRGRILAGAVESAGATQWPHPWAWRAVAACWAVILALHLSGPSQREILAMTPASAESPAVTGARYLAYVQERERWLEQVLADTRIDPRKL